MGRRAGIKKCANCGNHKYGYKDNQKSKFFICFTCGAYEGAASFELMEKVYSKPLILLEMIKKGELEKIV